MYIGFAPGHCRVLYICICEPGIWQFDLYPSYTNIISLGDLTI